MTDKFALRDMATGPMCEVFGRLNTGFSVPGLSKGQPGRLICFADPKGPVLDS